MPISAFLNSSNSLLLLQASPSNQKICPAIIENGVESSYLEMYSNKDLIFYSLDFGKQMKLLNLGISISSLNHPIYSENTFLSSYSKKILGVNFGTSVSYTSTKINYQKKKTINIAFGLNVNQNRWESQFSINAISLNNSEENELQINLENSYKISNNSKISVCLFRENGFDFSFKLGLSQNIKNYLTIISSYQYNPDRFGIGTVFKLHKIYVIYGIRTHQELDLTHALSVGYKF